MVKIRWIKDIFTGETEEWEASFHKGRRVQSYLNGKVVIEDLTVCEINGKPWIGKELHRRGLHDNDLLTVASIPSGPAIAILGIVLVTGASVLPAKFATLALILTILGTALTIVGGLLSAQKNKPPSPFSESDNAASPSRSFSGAQNTFGPGHVIPVVFGRHRVGGQIIESFLSPKLDTFDETDPALEVVEEEEEQDSTVDRLNTRMGVCHGPVRSLTELEIDDNPVEKIKGIQVETVLGTDGDPVLEGFEEETRQQRNVIQGIVNGSPVTIPTKTESGTDVPVTTVEVALVFPSGLFKVSATGAIEERSVSVTFEFKPTSTGSFIPYKTITISDSTQDRKIYWTRFPNFAKQGRPIEVYDIRVTRNTADNVDPQVQDDFRFEFLVMIQPGERAHPGIAQVGIRQVPQEQSAAPRKYSVLVDGIADMRVYSDETTFTREWSDSPAWCCAKWLTDPIYGLGRWYTYDDLDIPAFLVWDEHSREAIDNGRGIKVRRSRFNFVMDTSIRTQDMIQIFTTASDARLIDLGGKWTVILDQAKPVKKRFTEGSYSRESLTYTFRDVNSTAQRLSASFMNEENNYRRELMIQEDSSVSETEVYREDEIIVWGLTSPAMVANQLTKLVNQNRLQNRYLTFESGLSAFQIEVGDVIAMATRTGNVAIANGRITRVTGDTTTFEIDQEVTLDVAKTYLVFVQHTNDAALSKKRLANVVDGVKTNWLEVSDFRWERVLHEGDQYILVEIIDVEEEWIVTNSDLQENFAKKITALRYDRSVYSKNLVSNPDDSRPGTPPESTLMPEAVPSVTAFARKPELQFTLPGAGQSVNSNVIDVSWRADTGKQAFVGSYQVMWKTSTSNRWKIAGVTSGTNFCIADSVQVGVTYNVAVVAISHTGRKLHVQDSTQATITIPA